MAFYNHGLQPPLQSLRRGLLAFTLVETMVATLIIGILVALLLPAIMKAKVKGLQTFCTNNMRGVGVGMISWAESHDGNFPQQLPRAQGGTLPFLPGTIASGGVIANDIRPFLYASNTLGSAKILTCPTDRAKTPLTSFSQVKSNTVSYFTSVRPKRSNLNTLISGDNHISLQQSAASPIGYRPVWSTNRHDLYGNILFSDGHVESISSTNLGQIFYKAAAAGQ
ncbi:MAG: type II secretion system protein [Proteobacteria bacterium]|nr:type II secretion system protein [Pseudomonadota bacterium]